MKNVLTLTRVMRKASMQQFGSNKKGKKSLFQTNRLVRFVLLGISYVYIALIFGAMFYGTIRSLQGFGQLGLAFHLLFQVITIFTIFLTILIAPAVLYFSKDIESYLVLPVQPWEILVARFLTILSSNYLIALGVMIPFFVCYTLLVGFNVLVMLFFILAFVLVPIMPTALVSLFVVLIFTFIPFVRNKNVFTYITVFISLGLGLFVNMALSIPNLAPETLAILIASKNNSILNLVLSPFNPISHFARFVFNYNIVSFLITAAIALVSVYVLSLVAQKLYFKGAIGIGEVSAKKQRLSSQKQAKMLRSNSQLIAFFKYDLKLIMRTPIFFTNYYVGILILPLIFLFSLFTNKGLGELTQAIQEIIPLIHTVDPVLFVTYTILGSFFAGYGFSVFSTVASTSFTRDGETLTQFTTMPTSLKTLYHSKLLVAVSTLSVFPIVLAIGLTILLKVNPAILVIAILFILLGSTIAAINSIIFDILSPKLSWDSEEKAVKQNFVSVIAIFVNFGLTFVFGFLAFATPTHVAIPSVLGLSIVIGVVVYLVSQTLLKTTFLRKIENV